MSDAGTSAPRPPGPKVIVLGDLGMVSQLTYLDYIFNPCSLISINFSIIENFQYFTALSRDSPLFIKVPIGGTHVLGQVVSFQAFKDGAGKNSPLNISALLMPCGAAEPLTDINTPFSKDLLGRSQLAGINSSITTASVWPGEPELSFPVQSQSYIKSLSAMGAAMLWRRSMTQYGYTAYKSRKTMAGDASPLTFPHYLVYFRFGSQLTSSGGRDTTLPANRSWLLHGGINFANIHSRLSDFMATVKDKDSPDLQITFSAGNQGLANSAFAYIPEVSNTYSNQVSAAFNETFSVDFSGRLPSKFSQFVLDGSEANTFDRFKMPGNFDVPVPWGATTPCLHIKTMYQFVKQDQANSTGHRVQYTLARLNPALCPHGA
jgi:hypothetical protein